MKLQIVIPSARDHKPSFVSSICGLVRKLATADLEAFDMFIMQGASVLPKARNTALRQAIEKGFTHVLFLDDDMVFPPSLVHDLARHNLGVIGVNYTRKTDDRYPQTHDLDGNPVKSIDRVGVEEVGWIGFGAVLIKLDVLKDIPDPLFQMVWHPDRQDFLGEDYFFCWKVRSFGVPIYVDHDVSKKIAHIGDFAFTELPAEPIYDHRKEVA